MQGNKVISRRSFISRLSVFGLIPFLPLGSVNASKDTVKKDDYLNALIQVISEQASNVDCDVSSREVRNLTYAFAQVNPTSHHDMVMVVAFGSFCFEADELVDEYVRRRSGDESLLPDHPVMDIGKMGMPDTKRMPIFREQIDALFRELTNRSGPYCCELRRRLGAGKLWADEFASLLSKRYREELKDEEIQEIYDAMKFFNISCSSPYTWCSTMATRASALVRYAA